MDEAKAMGVSVVPLRHLVMPLNPVEDLLALRELSQVIHRFQPDLIHAHSSKAGLLSRVVARANRVPCVFTAHGWGFSEGVPLIRKCVVFASEWLAGRLGATTIAVSEFDRRLALRRHITPAQSIVTILNGIPDDSIRASPGQPATCPVITMVARFSPQKDHATLLEALRKVTLPFQLRLVGNGPLLNQIQGLVAKMHLADRVVFYGDSTQVPQILQQTHIFALISHYEGLPISILEAMRAGLPIVATDTGGVSEAVRHTWNGLLAPRGDAAAVRSNLEMLLSDFRLREAYGSNSRFRYEKGFLPEPMVTHTFDLYERVFS